MSKKSRERREKHLTREQMQKADPQPPPANQNQELIRPLIPVRICKEPDNGYIHPLERLEPVPLEEAYGQSPSDPSVNSPISTAPAASQPSASAEYRSPFPKSFFKTDSPSDNSKFHDFSSLIKDTSGDIDDTLMQNRIAMCDAMTPRTPDGVLMNHMSVGEVARAKIPVLDLPTNPTRENPIRPLCHASEFADGKTPDNYRLVDGFVVCQQGPDGNPPRPSSSTIPSET